MKLACILLLFVLGLLSANSFSIAELENDAEEDITSLDDLIQKSNTLKKVMAALEDALEGEHKDQKRLAEGFWEAVKKAGKKISDGAKKLIDKANAFVTKLVGNEGILDKAVKTLDGLMGKNTNERKCARMCLYESIDNRTLSYIGGEASKVCPYICTAAIAKQYTEEN